MRMTTETIIIYGWLFLLTLGVLALFAGWLGHGETLKLWRSQTMSLLVWRAEVDAAKQLPKPKRTRRQLPSTPIKLVPTTQGSVPRAPASCEVIDLSTPLAERVSGVGGTKPDSDGGEGPAAA
jgi:hypothetical protein